MTDSYNYDRIPYKSRAIPKTHPDHLAAMATLFGMKPRDIRNSRILELGCGDGANLIPMAYGLPDSELIGIDLSENAISKGQDMIGCLGLKNITLRNADIMNVGRDMRQFDYIIVHGVFSWVPHTVQERILDICKNSLAIQGVAFISYNTYPGCHLRCIVNEIMRFHTDHFPEPEQKITQARAILKFIADAAPSVTEAYGQVLSEEFRSLTEMNPDANSNYLHHDRLAEINQPFYFHEFTDRIGRHGMKYLAEADFFEMQDFFFEPNIRAMLRNLSGSSILVKEQFMDFIKGRRFRQTLLCHEEVSLDRVLHPKLMRNFCFSCPSRPVDENGEYLETDLQDLVTRENLKFRRPGGSVLETDHPVPRAALATLSRVWPMRLSFDELMSAGRMHQPQVSEDGDMALCDILLSAFSGNMVELHVHAPQFAAEPGEYPVASAIATHQIRAEYLRVTNLCHKTVELNHTYGHFLLPLLDGTRDRQAIYAEMPEIIRANDVPLNGKSPSEKTTGELIAEIDAELLNCAKYALIMK